MSDMTRWGDDQQYLSPPVPQGGPQVHLLVATPDPLGAIVAMAGIYSGKVVRGLADINDHQRVLLFEEVRKAHLQAPFEAVHFLFLVEGVDRGFTHQMVRTRTAVFAQESLRFAVVDEVADRVDEPPSIAALPDNDGRRAIWHHAVQDLGQAYRVLVENDIPAEDARGLLPHATKTRLYMSLDYRTLRRIAGDRLCTQAQFHWRLVLAKMMHEIRRYYLEHNDLVSREFQLRDTHSDDELGQSTITVDQGSVLVQDFAPVCYQLGHCPWGADFDRRCTIRERVQQYAEHGVPSERWGDGWVGLRNDHGVVGERYEVQPIKPEEWLANPGAAR